MSETDRFFSNQNMKLLCRDMACSVYRMKNETGDGTATYYQVFPGIYVLYNDFILRIVQQESLRENILSVFTIAERAGLNGK